MNEYNCENNVKEKKKSFLRDKKNIIIIILAFLLFCGIMSSDTSQTNTIDELNTKLNNSANEMKILNNQIKDKDAEIKKINQEKENLEKQIIELESQIENSQQTSSKIETSTNESNSSETSETNNISSMVWVGETGTKYHKQNCKTLKGNGHQITLEQAKSEGRQACKVCF